MAGPNAGIATRGTFWLAEAEQTQHAGPSTSRLQPQFANRLLDGDDPKALRACSQPFQAFPPCRVARNRVASSSNCSTSLRRLRTSHPEFNDVSDEILLQLFEASSGIEDTPCGQKFIVTPFASTNSAPLLLVNVGGPDDCEIYISALHPTRSSQSARRYKSKGKGKDTTDEEQRRKALLDVSLVPSYQSPSPILAIGLAPRDPPIRRSHLHEGPWLYIHTTTALHFCAIHHLGKSSRSKTAAQARPEYVMSHVCTFLTKSVAEAAQRQGMQGKLHVLDGCHVASAAWHPLAKTAALIGDRDGVIWLWNLNLTTKGTHQWISRGQSLRKVAQVPISSEDPLVQVSWLDGRAEDQAIVRTHEAIWDVDFSTGSCKQRKQVLISTTHLAPSSFHYMVNLNIPSTHDDPRQTLPLLLVISSLGIHVLDVFCPQRELLLVPHHRAFWDRTLRLTPIATNSETGEASMALSSSRDAAITVYRFGCQTFSSQSGQLQALRAWQVCPPTELVCSTRDHHFGGELHIHTWNECLPDGQVWDDWRQGNDLDGTGIRVAFLRTQTAEVLLTTMDHKENLASTDRVSPPIEVVSNPALDELRAIIAAEDGRTWRPRLKLHSSTTEKAPAPISLANVYSGLLDLSARHTAVHRQRQILHTLQHGAPPLDSLEPLFLTGMDIIASASLDVGSAPGVTPFANPLGAISALYHPHSLHLGDAGARLQHLLAVLLPGLNACRQQAWWDGPRWMGSGKGGSVSFPQDLQDVNAVTESLNGKTTDLIKRYVSDNSCPAASRLRSALTEILLHCSLAREIWSTRPIQIEVPKILGATDVDQHLSSQTSGLDKPGPWNLSNEPQTPSARHRRRRQDSVVGTPLATPSAKRKRDNREDFLSQWSQGSQYAVDASSQEPMPNDFDDEEDVEVLAQQKVPEPAEVHFAYFRPRFDGMSSEATSNVTTPAARLLLSSWPLTSVDPTDPDNDPSHYTFTDPYALLDAAKRSNEDGYGSSSTAHSTDTGWSSAWSGASASGISDSEHGRSRSQSVWSSSAFGGPGTRGGSAAVSSQVYPSSPSHFFGGSASQPVFRTRDGGLESDRQDGWNRAKAPPSIASRSAWDRDRDRSAASSQPHGTAAQSQPFSQAAPPFFPQSQGGFGNSGWSQTFSQLPAAAPPDAATQPMPGAHASRKAKKAKKRLGGF